MIAGHVFTLDGKCACGRRLTDIGFAAYDAEWVGKSDIAHTGTLTAHEQTEIRDAVEAIYSHAMEGARS
jgi:hypothetical protein